MTQTPAKSRAADDAPATLRHLIEVKKIRHRKDHEDAEEKWYEFIISDETPDRHGEVIPIKAWRLDNFQKNGIAAYMHETGGAFESNPDRILGPAKAYVEDGRLVGAMKFEPFNEFAQKIKQKVDFGTLKAVSVGFIPRSGHMGKAVKGEDEHTFYFDEVELTEFSIVHIGANPNAVRKSYGRAIQEYIQKHGDEHKELNQDGAGTARLAIKFLNHKNFQRWISM